MTKYLAALAALAFSLSVTARNPQYNIASTLKESTVSSREATASTARAGERVFFESFEYDDDPWKWNEVMADLSWLPEGWSRISGSSVNGATDRWYAHPMELITLVPCYDGNYAMTVLYNSEFKDEWLVSPDIQVGDDQYLTFWWYTVPLYFWVVDSKHIDFENSTFIDREIAATMKVMVSVEGGEWAEIMDLADNFAAMDYDELSDIYPETMTGEKISLADYAGHSVKIAFRYVGTDGNSIFIDGVGINNGLDKLDAIYKAPASAQYAGATVDGDILDSGYQIHPTGTPLHWENRSANPDGTAYSWNFGSLAVDESDNAGFTLKFPTPSSSFDLYEAPTLTAESEGSRSSSFAESAWLMAGGKPVFNGNDYGMMPFDVTVSGTATYTVEPEDFGQRGIPVFGYSEATGKYWHDRLAGNDPKASASISSAGVTGIMNVITTSGRPMVVDNAWLYAIGLIGDDASLTCSICPLASDGTIGPALATRTISGSDVMAIDTRINLLYYSIPFEFDSPVVIPSNSSCVVLISGFDGAGVEYFSPVMQYVPSPFDECTGLYRLGYRCDGVSREELNPVSGFENEHGAMRCAFAICLGGSYPWLECDDTLIDLGNGRWDVAMRSSYDGSDLAVTLADGSPLPSWLSASAKGQYDNTVVSFNVNGTPDPVDSDILVSAPGVALTLNIKQASSLDNIETSPASGYEEVYDLSGRKVVASGRQPGFYIVRDSNGRYRVVR